MNIQSLILRKFNYNYINANNLILILGPSKSGKSSITKDLIYNSNINNGCVFVKSHCNKKIYNYIPPLFIHDSYDKKFIKKIIKKQLSYDDSFENLFLIFEDILEYKHLEESKYLRKLLCNKLNNIFCIIEIIELSKIHETLLLKNKIDYLFITRDNYDKNKRLLYQLIKNNINIPYGLFCKFMDDYTDNYNFLILDCKSKSQNIADKLFWYKVDIHNNFRLNNEQLWNYNNNNYNNIL